ncbi:MAG TPA: hypothetical protein DCZ72_06575 [Armatimonadetes bacterium]|nr:hypothetical protein [Armatimonadota bacterium]
MKPLSMSRTALDRLPVSVLNVEECVDLSSDYSTFTVPRPVADAIVWAARSTDLGRHNTASGRYLREAVVEKLRAENGLEAREDSVVVTAGATAALCFILGAMCDAGDHILCPDPGPASYLRLAASWGASAERYPTELNGTPDWQVLDSLVRHETKALVVNSPSDPAGAILDPDLLRQYVDFAREHDLYVISDEQTDLLRYDGLATGGTATSDYDGRVVSVYSLARTHALYGLRLGYCVAAPALAEAIAQAQDAQLSGPSTLALAAGQAAFTMDRSVVDSMVATYQQARDVVEVNLSPEVLPFQPQSGYFMLVDVSHCGYPDSHAFAAELLSQKQLRVAPGTRFGTRTQQMIRLTLAVNERNLSRGIERLAEFMHECGAPVEPPTD